MVLKRLKRRTQNPYARGAVVAIDSFIREAITRRLPPDKAMQLVACFANALETMVKDKDTEPPFLTRAVAKALNNAGVEDYDSALARIIKQSEDQKLRRERQLKNKTQA